MDIPFWMYFVVMGIMISGYMVVKTGKDEKKIEDEIIEREGEVYMKRLEKSARRKRQKRNQWVYNNKKDQLLSWSFLWCSSELLFFFIFIFI